MFGRKNKYREVVAEARKYAKETNQETVVFQVGKKYGYCREQFYRGCFLSESLLTSSKPVIKLLICLPDGTVAQ